MVICSDDYPKVLFIQQSRQKQEVRSDYVDKYWFLCWRLSIISRNLFPLRLELSQFNVVQDRFL
ncbi:hypothetical protein [Candidatus Symbiopectobacterium sp.]|uniref:hypothetical protein n=1 Tax=Candidatus Symbiopectobacterium sp. TaxID=2816440 RepID=UPI0025BB94BA|nr:hypothetical protein [Candidatus Symbiopectobacterium sp.]